MQTNGEIQDILRFLIFAPTRSRFSGYSLPVSGSSGSAVLGHALHTPGRRCPPL